jgi:hypothetical protein
LAAEVSSTAAALDHADFSALAVTDCGAFVFPVIDMDGSIQ